jgi:hypothetical protein
MKSYTVSTLHDDPSFDKQFIVGVRVEASSHFEAARKRFSYLAEVSKNSTLALLVEGGGKSEVFAVRERQATTREVVE